MQFARELLALGFLNGHQSIDQKMIVGLGAGEAARQPVELLADLAQFGDANLIEIVELPALQTAQAVHQLIQGLEGLPRRQCDQYHDRYRNRAEQSSQEDEASQISAASSDGLVDMRSSPRLWPLMLTG